MGGLAQVLCLYTPREQGENGPRAGSVEHTPLSDATHVLSALLIRELDIGLTPKSLIDIERDTTYTAIFSYKHLVFNLRRGLPRALANQAKPRHTKHDQTLFVGFSY